MMQQSSKICIYNCNIDVRTLPLCMTATNDCIPVPATFQWHEEEEEEMGSLADRRCLKERCSPVERRHASLSNSNRSQRSSPYHPRHGRPRCETTKARYVPKDEVITALGWVHRERELLQYLLASPKFDVELLLCLEGAFPSVDRVGLFEKLYENVLCDAQQVKAEQLKEEKDVKEEEDMPEQWKVTSPFFDPKEALKAAMDPTAKFRLPVLAKPWAGVKRWYQRVVEDRWC